MFVLDGSHIEDCIVRYGIGDDWFVGRITKQAVGVVGVRPIVEHTVFAKILLNILCHIDGLQALRQFVTGGAAHIGIQPQLVNMGIVF